MTEQHLLQLEARLASDRRWFSTIVIKELIAEVRRLQAALTVMTRDRDRVSQELDVLHRAEANRLHDEQEERA